MQAKRIFLFTLSVKDVTIYRRGKKNQTSPLHPNLIPLAATPTSAPRPRASIVKMGKSGLFCMRIFARLPSKCLYAYRALHKKVLPRYAGLVRAHGSDAQATTDSVQDRELLNMAVAKQLYQGEDGRSNEYL